VGAAVCAGVAPEHFRLENGVSTPVTTSVEPNNAVLDAAESCPVEAILVRESDGSVLAPQT